MTEETHSKVESKKRHDEINEKLGKLFKWQVDHQDHDNNAFNEISLRFDVVESNIGALPTVEDIAEIKAMLLPISETYGTVISLGKWGKWGLGTLLLLLSIAVAAKSLFVK
jgi:hypothetical protein